MTMQNRTIEIGKIIPKAFPCEVKGVDEKARTIRHVITTASKDRDGDTINPKGWVLEGYRKNPVVLFGHRHDFPPIARNTSIQPTDDGLIAVTEFPEVGIYELADQVFALNAKGFLRTWSVGFSPIEWTMLDDGGVRFESQELFEYSSVPVPANSEAMNLAVSKGIITARTLPLFLFVPRPQAKAAAPPGAKSDEPLPADAAERLKAVFDAHRLNKFIDAERHRAEFFAGDATRRGTT